MRYLKEKFPIIIIGVIIFLMLCVLATNFLEAKPITYYTQIDNNKITKLSTNDSMKYEYKLRMYNEKGKSKEIKFKTSRKLREGAYLKVKYINISGVNKWEEIKQDELPVKVQEKYKK